jgi:hypothetical protein
MRKKSKERKPWELQEGEPKDAYSHFLAYRNLGPGRSIDAAYFMAKESGRGRKKRPTRAKRAPSNWGLESVAWNWVERAIAWDIENLETQGRAVVTMYFAALQKAALKILTALDAPNIRPKSWQGVLDGLHELSNVIPPETVAALRAHAGGPGGAGAAGADAGDDASADGQVDQRPAGVDRHP